MISVPLARSTAQGYILVAHAGLIHAPPRATSAHSHSQLLAISHSRLSAHSVTDIRVTQMLEVHHLGIAVIGLELAKAMPPTQKSLSLYLIKDGTSNSIVHLSTPATHSMGLSIGLSFCARSVTPFHWLCRKCICPTLLSTKFLSFVPHIWLRIQVCTAFRSSIHGGVSMLFVLVVPGLKPT